jgi:hypothetical protein
MVATTKQPSLIGLWPVKENQIMRKERGIEEKRKKREVKEYRGQVTGLSTMVLVFAMVYGCNNKTTVFDWSMPKRRTRSGERREEVKGGGSRELKWRVTRKRRGGGECRE